jgi:signal transduction histidine kinase
MSETRADLQQEYDTALAEHIVKADEATLTHAYELGRRVLSGGFGVLDLVSLYSEAFGRFTESGAYRESRNHIDRAAEFVAESLSAFEMALRGAREANARLTALHDSLERKVEERTQELTKANRVKDEFLATVSHELRTPLTSISGVVALLHSGQLGALPARAGRVVKIAHHNCERLTCLVNDLIDVTMINTGSLKFNLQPVELAALIEHAADARRCAAAIHTRVDDDVKRTSITADASRIAQVIDNLLSNALKFSPDNSPIELSAARNGNTVRVSVIDHGIGISEKLRDHVFKPFTQVDSSSTRDRGGAGLGLSIAKTIVEAHGGTIGFSSVEGEGATFYFDLPLQRRTVHA